MPFVSVGKENGGSIELYYEDHASGKPVVLIHGWPLSSASWEKQVPPLLASGHRVIAYDRRGFGHSSKPAVGYNYDTLAEDLHTLLTKLDLRDVTLVGFSMGGGEVARYFGKFGDERVSRAVFMSAITPALLKGPDNEEGVEPQVFEKMRLGIMADRPAFLASFLHDFYNAGLFKGKRISDEALRLSWNIASGASPLGTLASIDAWLEDFRDDLKRVNVPTLVVHGKADHIVPFEASGKRMQDILRNARLVAIDGAPHGLNWTHPEEANHALMEFLGAPTTTAETKARRAA